MMARRQSGFTFVEMGIVLIIIGIILASVMKATDIYHSAQIDKVNKVFFEAWKTVVYEYYDRRGQYLGDGTINGGTTDPVDGRFDGFQGIAQSTELIDVIRDQAGIDVCSMVQSNTPLASGAATPNCGTYDILQREVSGGFRSSSLVQVGFYSYQIDDILRNCLVFTDVPIDIAQRISKYYDGVADGQQGSVRVTDTGNPNAPAVDGDGNVIFEDFFDPTDATRRSALFNLVMILQF